ncbi:hypothetical protein [Kingella negevensis]|uniref:hypothetical protein n=1 Tax=Kingella negevensis TaxID=1522312 RepID=UPI00050A1BB1|nr:hypothetical protein [Kingella negevensis]
MNKQIKTLTQKIIMEYNFSSQPLTVRQIRTHLAAFPILAGATICVSIANLKTKQTPFSDSLKQSANPTKKSRPIKAAFTQQQSHTENLIYTIHNVHQGSQHPNRLTAAAAFTTVQTISSSQKRVWHFG